ncbi:MAG: response regulator [Deltaproteobacteria bacterium]|nr:response regulator [Deltaproteobacteria bacterium]MBW2064827.1 response regulator [Deltaproteobacteria bacterium]
MLGAKILLVDDEVVFTENMAKLLSSRGYRVTTANSGDDAIGMLGDEEFDVVVLDLKMPGMDGLSVLKKIKEMGVITEILILTGQGSIDSALEAIKLGAYDYLTKPCEIDELVSKVEGAWDKKDEELKKDMQEKIQRVVESPSAVFDVFPRKKK